MYDIANIIAKYHNPNAPQECDMVWSVWSDGEITLEKGKELFGQRNLHMMELPLKGREMLGMKFHEAFPMEGSGFYKRMYTNTEEDALAVRKWIRDIITGEA